MIPTSTDVTFLFQNNVPAKVQAVVFFVGEGSADEHAIGMPDGQIESLERLTAGGVVRGKFKEVKYDVADASSRTFYVGLGKPEKVTVEMLRQLGGRIERALRRERIGAGR